jgi:hypothetical protein
VVAVLPVLVLVLLLVIVLRDCNGGVSEIPLICMRVMATGRPCSNTYM